MNQSHGKLNFTHLAVASVHLRPKINVNLFFSFILRPKIKVNPSLASLYDQISASIQFLASFYNQKSKSIQFSVWRGPDATKNQIYRYNDPIKFDIFAQIDIYFYHISWTQMTPYVPTYKLNHLIAKSVKSKREM